MAEIEITLPTVQYGSVKIRATPEELGVPDVSNADQIGFVTAVYLNLFTQGFENGAQQDVRADLAAKEREMEAQAAALLGEGLGGVTEVDEYDSATEAKEAAQARTAGAPWEAKVDAKPKPWETGETAPKAVVTEGW